MCPAQPVSGEVVALTARSPSYSSAGRHGQLFGNFYAEQAGFSACMGNQEAPATRRFVVGAGGFEPPTSSASRNSGTGCLPASLLVKLWIDRHTSLTISVKFGRLLDRMLTKPGKPRSTEEARRCQMD
jgi:hypothetical protein